MAERPGSHEVAYRSMAEYYSTLGIRGSNHRTTNLSDGTTITLITNNDDLGFICFVWNHSVEKSYDFIVGRDGLRAFGVNNVRSSLLDLFDPVDIAILGEGENWDQKRSFQEAAKPLVDWVIKITLDDRLSDPPLSLVERA